MLTPSVGRHRMHADVIKLIQNNYKVTILADSVNELMVKFYGPTGTYYEGGVWNVRVHLSEQYPFKSPSIGFMNKIYHPNVEEMSGSVCLNALNQTWTALYDLLNIFDSFLPQLLMYPNPYDSLNAEAATLFIKSPEQYKKKVFEYVHSYAKEDIIKDETAESDSESSVSDYLENDIDL